MSVNFVTRYKIPNKIMLLHQRVQTLLVFLFCSTNNAGRIWLDVPEEHVQGEKGSTFSLQWHYQMGENETFLSSELTRSQNGNQLDIASRHKGDNEYYKYPKAKKLPVLIRGKNNITLILNSPTIGYNTTYCCTVIWRSKSFSNRKETNCSTIFIYDLPRITYYEPYLSCRQGDSITLLCNATGYPEPRVQWIHNNTQGLMNESSNALFNITGKKSGGSYCCDANNGFGRKTACTTVDVTEYEPEDTSICVTRTYRYDVNMLTINIKCKAIASPPPEDFFITINDEQYNSSNGVKTFNTRPEGQDIVITCRPSNKYGHGPRKEITLPGHVPPSFRNLIRTQYKMTIGGITIECGATGNPLPSIRWTIADTGEIVGTNHSYVIPYIKCVNKTITLFCHAANVMGNISSPKIVVNVMTQHNCTTTEKGSTRPTMNLSKDLYILIIGICCGFFASIFIIVFTTLHLYRKRKLGRARKDKKEIDENPYQEPIDHRVGMSEEELLNRNTSPDDDGYATLEECGFTMRTARSSFNASEVEV